MYRVFQGLLLSTMMATVVFSRPAPSSVTAIAKEAFIYGYPIVENYRVMYYSTQDKNYPHYANEADVFLGVNGFEPQSDGKPFSGNHKYTITFQPNSQPPVDAFWSITLYQLPSRFLNANTLGRYSINSRTFNQLKNGDGSVTIYLQHKSPGTASESNWLRCPQTLFTKALRCYLPRQELRTGQWPPPPVVIVG